MAEVKIKIISYKSNGQKPGEDPPGFGPLSIDRWLMWTSYVDLVLFEFLEA